MSTRERSKGRKNSARVCVIPHSVLDHPSFIELSGAAIRLLIALAQQYNGHSNNGDLTASWTIMKERGFKSKDTLSKALASLISKGFIIRTREGRFCNPGKRCALYALTWKNIDECPGKELEIRPTNAPVRAFSISNVVKLPGTETVPSGYGIRGERERKQS